MRELKQDWRDLFGGFKVAFDIWKLVLAFLGLAVTILCFWGIGKLPVSVTVGILAGLVVIGLFVKFATSETGLTAKKLTGLIVVMLLLGGLSVLLYFMLRDKILPISHLFVLLVIWALFGGAITRIAVVEISTDDRLSIGEALCYARRRYTAYLGSTILPLLAVGIILLCCFAYGLLFRLPVVNIVLSALFFIVILAAFMMTLIALGGIAGAPLMYPAVSAEGNDAFDAISRSYSYVFGRPWRYLFYNLMGFIYGVVCVFFVTMFVLGMLRLSTGAIKAGTDRASATVVVEASEKPSSGSLASEESQGTAASPVVEGAQEAPMADAGETAPKQVCNKVWSDDIVPRVRKNVLPILEPVVALGTRVSGVVNAVDPTGFVGNLCGKVLSRVQQAVAKLGENPDVPVKSPLGVPASAWFITIAIYGLLGLVLSYIVSLFFSLQSTIYLLLRKAVDGADMNEVYLEEEMEEEQPKPEPAA